MKQNLLLALAFCAALCANAQTQLQNSALDTWNGNTNPQYWATNYTDDVALGNTYAGELTLVTRDATNNSNGIASTKMIVAYTTNSPSAMQAGHISASSNLNGQQNGSDRVPITTAPDSIYFEFDYIQANANDEAEINVELYDADGLAINASGTNGIGAFVNQTTGGWYGITIPLTTYSNAAYIAVTFYATDYQVAPTDVTAGTTLWVDNINLIYAASGCPTTFTVTPINPACNGGGDGGGSASWTGVPTADVAFWIGTAASGPILGPYTPTSNPYTVTGLGGAGNYVLQMQTTSGCTVNKDFTIGNNPVLNVSVSATPTSGGNNNGTASVTASGGVPTYTYSWSNEQHTPNITGLAPATYTCTVTDDAGCSKVETAIVGYPGPTVTTNAASGIHLTNATLNATVNPNGTTDTVSFDWGTSTSYGNNNPASPSPVNGSSAVSVSTSLFGLVANTTYYYRAVATTLGTPYYGAQQTFYTSATGIPQVSIEDATIYPNPAKHQFTINTQSTESYQLFVYNMMGQKVVSQIISQAVTNVDVSLLSTGVYTVTLVKDEAVKSFRQVIINE